MTIETEARYDIVNVTCRLLADEGAVDASDRVSCDLEKLSQAITEAIMIVLDGEPAPAGLLSESQRQRFAPAKVDHG